METKYQYEYDDYNNWILRKEFQINNESQNIDGGLLISIETRKIKYYE